MAASGNISGWKFAEDLLKNKWFWVAVVVIILAVVIKRAIETAKLTPSKKPLPLDYVDPNFDPTAYTNALADAVDDTAWSSSYHPEAYQNALNLSDVELTMVYNDWIDRFFGDDNKTLTQALQGHTIYGAIFEGSNPGDAVAYRDQLISRLITMGLN